MTSIVKGLFGGSSSGEKILQKFTPSGFYSPGLKGTFENNQFRINRSPNMNKRLGELRRNFDRQAGAMRDRAEGIRANIPMLTNLRGELGDLRPGLQGLRRDIQGLRAEVRPGFGRLTRSRVEALRNLEGRAVGNLREELAHRRVLGSSFAAREIGALESQFAQEEDRIRAESFLAEMDATNQLLLQELGITGEEADIITQQFGMAMQEAGMADMANQVFAESFNSSIAGAQAILEQMNLEAGMAAGLSQIASQLINANLTAQAEARTAQEVGAMNFLADVIGASIIGSE